jgi:pimeloyl-ACP methyl ester carboxylesterase
LNLLDRFVVYLQKMPGIGNQIILADSRRLGFAEFGDRNGKPVFYFHGFPGSRLEAQLAEKIARDTHVRFIGIDRPGFGLSEFKPQRTLLDWVNDVCELADALQIDRFSILSISGGGPYAAACAYEIPHRLDSVGIVCGMGPVEVPGLMDHMFWVNRYGLRIAGRFPRMAKSLFLFSAFFLRNYPEHMLSFLSGNVQDPDKFALKNAEFIKVLSASFREAFLNSLLWPSTDFILYSRPWGFHLQDIRIRIHLWHGEKDRIVPLEMGRYMAKTLPDCCATFYSDEGHFSIILNRITEFWKIFLI